MTDRELLKLAARAAGYKWRWFPWNPLANDGDALRLAVKLGIRIDLHPGWVYARAVAPDGRLNWLEITQGWAHTKEPYAATRRAIVRAAAQIAHSVPGSPARKVTRPDEQDAPGSSIGLGAEGEQ